MFYVSRKTTDEWTPLSDGKGNRVPYRGKDLVTILCKSSVNNNEPLELAHCKMDEKNTFQPDGGTMEMYCGEIVTTTNANTLCYKNGHIIHGLAKEFYPRQ